MFKINQLKQKLKSGQAVIGPWCTIPSPHLANVIASSGVDFVILDMEHGPISFETAFSMILACEAENCTPLIRVKKNDEAEILNALDIGAQGIIVPHIETAEDAKKAISHIKYSPLGDRGFSPYTKAGRYQGGKNYTAEANMQVLSILIVEGESGLDNLDEIIKSTNEIDVIYIGAYDLSNFLGIPGKVHDPQVKKQIEEAVIKIKANGIIPSSFVAKTAEDIRWLIKIGVPFITTWVDANFILKSFQDICTILKNIK